MTLFKFSRTNFGTVNICDGIIPINSRFLGTDISSLNQRQGDYITIPIGTPYMNGYYTIDPNGKLLLNVTARYKGSKFNLNYLYESYDDAKSHGWELNTF